MPLGTPAPAAVPGGASLGACLQQVRTGGQPGLAWRARGTPCCVASNWKLCTVHAMAVFVSLARETAWQNQLFCHAGSPWQVILIPIYFVVERASLWTLGSTATSHGDPARRVCRARTRRPSANSLGPSSPCSHSPTAAVLRAPPGSHLRAPPGSSRPLVPATLQPVNTASLAVAHQRRLLIEILLSVQNLAFLNQFVQRFFSIFTQKYAGCARARGGENNQPALLSIPGFHPDA